MYHRWVDIKTKAEAGYSPLDYLESKFTPRSDGYYNTFKQGLAWYMVCLINSARMANKFIELTDTQLAEVRNTVSEQSRHTALSDSVTAGILKSNNRKNLIFIIVESLNSRQIGHLHNGRSITPVLDSLIKLPGSIVSLNMTPQISIGGSSDGQLIYNTGLLPILSGINAQQYGNNEYPALAKSLSVKSAVEYIVENASIWNHSATNRAYGYNKLYACKDLEAAGLYDGEIGCDAAIFTFALDKLKELPQPFMAEVVTLSMHHPFTDAGVPGIDIDDPLERYLLSLNFFDTHLGKFLNGIKKSGLYDNSIIVIASDHNVNITGDEPGIQPIAFIALNTGVTRHVTQQTWQSDVFPTVLDIMGVDTGNGYRGLGASLLLDSIPVRDKVYWTRMRSVSDLMIRSDYFRH